MALSVVSINVNGIRAAARKGLLGWIETRELARPQPEAPARAAAAIEQRYIFGARS